MCVFISLHSLWIAEIFICVLDKESDISLLEAGSVTTEAKAIIQKFWFGFLCKDCKQ